MRDKGKHKDKHKHPPAGWRPYCLSLGRRGPTADRNSISSSSSHNHGGRRPRTTAETATEMRPLPRRLALLSLPLTAPSPFQHCRAIPLAA